MMNLVKVRVDITDQFSLTEVEIETEFGNKVGSRHIVLFVRWVDKKVLWFDLMDGC